MRLYLAGLEAFAGNKNNNYKLYLNNDIISMATSMCIIEAIIALIDTSFLYISKKISG